MKIAVAIPSRLQPNPLAMEGRIFLNRAVGSVYRQTVYRQHEFRIVVGLSPGHHEQPAIDGVTYVTAAIPGQAEALNAATRAAGEFDVLAFLEDDDHWEPKKLEYQLGALDRCFDFVSSNQREVDVEGSFVRINDFATMSGWLMTRSCWKSVGEFDQSFKWHLDNDWLGRLKQKRVHLLEHGADKSARDWMRIISQFSSLGATEEMLPLVVRTVNPQGGMSTIAREQWAQMESADEHRRLVEKYGYIPW